LPCSYPHQAHQRSKSGFWCMYVKVDPRRSKKKMESLKKFRVHFMKFVYAHLPRGQCYDLKIGDLIQITAILAGI
jgi:hypothetical protein